MRIPNPESRNPVGVHRPREARVGFAATGPSRRFRYFGTPLFLTIRSPGRRAPHACASCARRSSAKGLLPHWPGGGAGSPPSRPRTNTAIRPCSSSSDRSRPHRSRPIVPAYRQDGQWESVARIAANSGGPANGRRPRFGHVRGPLALSLSNPVTSDVHRPRFTGFYAGRRICPMIGPLYEWPTVRTGNVWKVERMLLDYPTGGSRVSSGTGAVDALLVAGYRAVPRTRFPPGPATCVLLPRGARPMDAPCLPEIPPRG